jgi:hypothetical protein
MKTFLLFLASAVTCFLLLTFVLKPTGVKAINPDKTYVLSPAQVDSVQQKLPIDLRLNLTANDLTPTDIVKYVLSLLGGFLTSIILYFLHKWFPNIFTSSKVKDYKVPRP